MLWIEKFKFLPHDKIIEIQDSRLNIYCDVHTHRHTFDIWNTCLGAHMHELFCLRVSISDPISVAFYMCGAIAHTRSDTTLGEDKGIIIIYVHYVEFLSALCTKLRNNNSNVRLRPGMQAQETFYEDTVSAGLRWEVRRCFQQIL